MKGKALSDMIQLNVWALVVTETYRGDFLLMEKMRLKTKSLVQKMGSYLNTLLYIRTMENFLNDMLFTFIYIHTY